MKKWLLAIVLALVVIVGGTCYRLIRSVRETPDHVTQVVHGSQADVFAALSHVDSLRRWLPQGAQVSPVDLGTIQPGDTLTVRGAELISAGEEKPVADEWTMVVQEVRAPDLLVTAQMIRDSTGQFVVGQIWRDSLTALGDSTLVQTQVVLTPAGMLRRRPGDTSTAMRTVDYLALGIGAIRAQGRLNQLAEYYLRRGANPTP